MKKRRNRNNVRRKEFLANRVFGLLTVLLISITVFCTTMTVKGQEKNSIRADEQEYRKLEQDYMKNIRGYLKGKGFENSGIALTKVIEEDGSRAYTLQIHHKRIQGLSAPEKEDLREALEEFSGFGGAGAGEGTAITVIF